MKLRKNIATSEAGFVFNPGTGDSFSLNPLGSEIIALLKENKSETEITDLICERYDVDSTKFMKDLEDFLFQLSGYNLLEA